MKDVLWYFTWRRNGHFKPNQSNIYQNNTDRETNTFDETVHKYVFTFREKRETSVPVLSVCVKRDCQRTVDDVDEGVAQHPTFDDGVASIIFNTQGIITSGTSAPP